MKKIIIFINIFLFSSLSAEQNIKFYLEKAVENNLQINAERKNLESAKQSKNISRSEFLPNITISGDQTSSTSSNQTNRQGNSIADSNLDTEKRTISVEQKIFSGFKGVNTFKKSELETKKANLKLLQTEQKTILEAAIAYFDLIYKFKNENFNNANLNLFERQVESDSARLQKGEITLTDMAQSESSLAGAKANLIKAKTELSSSKSNFERVTREQTPDIANLKDKVFLKLPNSLAS
jgi:outer membrane protein